MGHQISEKKRQRDSSDRRKLNKEKSCICQFENNLTAICRYDAKSVEENITIIA
jgi:hypothetical protein